MNHDKLLLLVPAAALEFFILPLCVLIGTCVSYCSRRSNFLSSGSAVVGTKKELLVLLAAAPRSAAKPSPGNFPGRVSEYPLGSRPPLPEPVAPRSLLPLNARLKTPTVLPLARRHLANVGRLAHISSSSRRRVAVVLTV